MKSVGYGQFRRRQTMLFFIQRFYRPVGGDKSEPGCQYLPVSGIYNPRPRLPQFIFDLKKHSVWTFNVQVALIV